MTPCNVLLSLMSLCVSWFSPFAFSLADCNRRNKKRCLAAVVDSGADPGHGLLLEALCFHLGGAAIRQLQEIMLFRSRVVVIFK